MNAAADTFAQCDPNVMAALRALEKLIKLDGALTTGLVLQGGVLPMLYTIRASCGLASVSVTASVDDGALWYTHADASRQTIGPVDEPEATLAYLKLALPGRPLLPHTPWGS